MKAFASDGDDTLVVSLLSQHTDVDDTVIIQVPQELANYYFQKVNFLNHCKKIWFL